MIAQTIAQLAWYKPYSQEVLYQAQELSSSLLQEERTANILHYAECHKNLQFGWDFAQELAKHTEIQFPAILHGDDIFVWRAYKYLLGQQDPVISATLALTSPDNKVLTDQIKALLIVDDVTHGFVANKLHLPIETVIAYEKLFFNVIDRKKDHAFIASIVYPEGRLVEAMESYVENTGMDQILLRAGFTKGSDHVLYAIGLKENPYANEDAAEQATRLDRTFLADGCLYATMGWANQRANARPILNARASMLAGKMGKGTDDSNSLTCITPGDTFKQELIQIAKLKTEAAAKRAASQVVPVLPANNNTST